MTTMISLLKGMWHYLRSYNNDFNERPSFSFYGYEIFRYKVVENSKRDEIKTTNVRDINFIAPQLDIMRIDLTHEVLNSEPHIRLLEVTKEVIKLNSITSFLSIILLCYSIMLA
jgi:hypothetical protein